MKDLGIKKAQYVESILTYKDLDVSLHVPHKGKRWLFMKPLLKAISNNDIFNS